MKRIGEIMKEMGFQKDSSEQTQKAFIKYLIRVANKNRQPLLELESDEPDHWSELKTVANQTQVNEALSGKNQSTPEQLSFQFGEEEKKSLKSG